MKLKPSMIHVACGNHRGSPWLISSLGSSRLTFPVPPSPTSTSLNVGVGFEEGAAIFVWIQSKVIGREKWVDDENDVVAWSLILRLRLRTSTEYRRKSSNISWREDRLVGRKQNRLDFHTQDAFKTNIPLAEHRKICALSVPLACLNILSRGLHKKWEFFGEVANKVISVFLQPACLPKL